VKYTSPARKSSRTVACGPTACRAGAVLLLLACVLGPARRSSGDATEDLPVRVSEIPKVLFIVERYGPGSGPDYGMNTNWYGNSNMPTRWQVVREAIIAAVNSAPTEMEFALIGTSGVAAHYKEMSSFDEPTLDLTRALYDASNQPDLVTEYIGSSYGYVVDEYLSIDDDTHLTDEGFARAPFRESGCSEIDVIIIGDRMGGLLDDDVTNLIFTGDKYLTVQPEDEQDRTLLDDVAFDAANNDVALLVDGTQTVRTHTIFVDADTVNDQDVEDLFLAAASVGSGLYTRAVHPDDVAVGISLAMTDKIRSLTGITSSLTSAVGHRLFRGWTEIWGFTDDTRGVPLYRGHFEAFQVENDPSDPDYGDVEPTALWMPGPSSPAASQRTARPTPTTTRRAIPTPSGATCSPTRPRRPPSSRSR